MTLLTATRWSAAIAVELAPHCHRLEIAGSIRRSRPQCGDIDIVCIPKADSQTDLLGAELVRTNAVLEWARAYARKCQGQVTGPGDQVPRIISGGEREGKQLIVQLRNCQLDLWFASEKNFASRFLCRTGSREHNIWFATRLTERNMHWFPYEGIVTLDSLRAEKINPYAPGAADRAVEKNLILPAGTESDLYGYAGLELIAPEHRELAWLQKNIDSGL
jgi:DNA polymerase/3'-5' exonuclease PolX